MLVMLGHGLVSGALFLCVGVVYDRLHTREIDRYGGLSDNMPGYALLFMVFTMASVGLPGTSNFVGEFLSLVGTYRASSWAAIVATHRHHPRRGLHALALLAHLLRHAAPRRCGGDARPRRARMVAAGADRRSRCSGWASIPKASCGRCATTSAACSTRMERVAPAGRFAPDARQGARRTWITERRTDGPLRAAPARADPVDRRHDPDDGRGVHRAARLGAWSTGSRSRCCLPRPSR